MSGEGLNQAGYEAWQAVQNNNRGEQASPQVETAAMAVERVLQYFDQKEFEGRRIPGREQLIRRLEMLQAGKPIDVICFNCIDFRFRPAGKKYPQAEALDDTRTALVRCYKPEFTETVQALQYLGTPRVTIVVPDSELTDDDVFHFAQKPQQRAQIGQKIQRQLTEDFSSETIDVALWSEFLANRGLPSPREYTADALSLVMGKFRRNVKDMYDETEHYLASKGLSSEQIAQIHPAEITTRSAWYLAMYAGEGAAMADLMVDGESNALVLNFENDGKVTKWYQRGAQAGRTDEDVLPIITPADVRRFKPWKEEIKKVKKSGVAFERKSV